MNSDTINYSSNLQLSAHDDDDEGHLYKQSAKERERARETSEPAQ